MFSSTINFFWNDTFYVINKNIRDLVRMDSLLLPRNLEYTLLWNTYDDILLYTSDAWKYFLNIRFGIPLIW